MIDFSSLDRDDIRLVQTGLKSRGHFAGDLGGHAGPITQAAYHAYRQSRQQVAGPAVPGEAGPVLRAMIAAALSKDGVREIPRNSNRGPDVQKFQAATWLDGTGWAWCAAFVCWALREGLDRTPPGLTPARQEWRPRTAGAWDMENWARKSPGVQVLKPAKGLAQAGDLFVFRSSHIGIVIADQAPGSETIATIEGNTDRAGSREGGGVYRKFRKPAECRSLLRILRVPV